MIAPSFLYYILYALAARDGREGLLFGASAPRAQEAFERSLVGTAFPELWFELPLVGEPWFDLHVLAAHSDLREAAPDALQASEHPEVFSWFAAQEQGVRQLALSWDVGRGDVETPAVQLLVSVSDPQVTCGFLEAAGRADAVAAYRAFRARIPADWFACYAGVFPERTEPFLRVECIPRSDMQQQYAREDGLLERHLRELGLRNVNESLVERCRFLASQPFQFEFQFDVDAQGCPGDTVAASLRFAAPPGTEGWQAFSAQGKAADLMRQVEAWGLADDRWQALADTAFVKNLNRNGEAALIYCYPAFLKIRWRAGEALDAKTYLIARAEMGA